MAANGIELTLRTLLRSTHPRATDLLAIALEGPAGALRDGAVRCLALRDDPAGRRLLVESQAALDPARVALLRDLPANNALSQGLPALIRQSTPKLAKRAGELAVALSEVGSLPAVVEAALDAPEAYASALAADALRLARVLDQRIEAYEGWSQESGKPRPADPVFLRRAAVNALTMALKRYDQKPLGDLLHALLVLTTPDESALLQAQRDVNHPAHSALQVALRTSKSRGAIGVLAAALGDLKAPQSILEIATQRCDREGLQRLLERVGAPVGLRVRENCSRIESFAWLEPGRVEALADLSGTAQIVAVQLAAASKANRRLVARAIRTVLTSPHAEARVAACRAIESLPLSVTTDLLTLALDSEDLEVVAAAAKLLRIKCYPRAAVILVEMLDHESPVIRAAAGSSLQELSFTSFREAVDDIPGNLRSKVGRLVVKADGMTAATLRTELGVASVSRRLRALELIELTGVAGSLAGDLAARLKVEGDLGVGVELARLLGGVEPSDLVIDALLEATKARQLAVREAARAALERLTGAPLGSTQEVLV